MIGVGVAVAVAAAGIDEVREVELVETLRLHEVEHGGQAFDIALGDGEAQADLDAVLPEQADALKRGVVGARDAAEPVVDGADAVQAHADIVVADLGDALGRRLVDQRPVRGQADIEAHCLRPGRDGEDVGPQQWLAAGEDQHRNARGLQVVHDLEDLLGRELAREVHVAGERVAVDAVQVAAPDQVPDHHRARRLRVAHRRGLDELAHELAQAEHDLSPYPASLSPVFFRMRLL